MARLIKVDFHCHTSASADAHIQLLDLPEACNRRGIQRLAITDHNTIDGALEAAARWPDLIIPGLEIMTSRGELLAYYVKQPVEHGLEPMETIRKLKAQGAVISVSHPFDIWRNGGWRKSWLFEILPFLDAVEIFNAHCFSNLPNRMAQDYARTHGLAGTAGSDAHTSREIGAAGLTLADFHNAAGLRKALNATKLFGNRASIGMRLVNRIKRGRHRGP
jgi:predicted metal-dependent phosphoesterase TrpH